MHISNLTIDPPLVYLTVTLVLLNLFLGMMALLKYVFSPSKHD